MTGLALFDYAGLDVSDQGEVRAAAERIRLRPKRTAEDIVAIGLDLIAAKERLPHGAFGDWIHAEFGMSESAATKIMNVGKAYGGKSVIITDLTPTVLYELSAPSTPEPVREEIERIAGAGDKVSVDDVKRLKAEHQRQLAERDDALEQAQLEAERRVSEAQKGVEALAEERAQVLAQQEISKREAGLKDLRKKEREARQALDRAREREAETKARVAEHEDYLRKIASAEHEAKDLGEELQALSDSLTKAMLVVHGLEHEHSGSVVAVANKVASMCGQMQEALGAVGTTRLSVVE